MNKIYYLSTCTTCLRIIKELKITKKKFVMQDIKKEKITASQLDEMKKVAGSYEPLFSKASIKFRKLGLDKLKLSETDYKKFLLEEYTFLKRPVIVFNGKLFIGNSKNTIAEAKLALK